MRDILPDQARRWDLVEDQLTAILRGHAYEMIRLPLLEFTELFARGVGEATDIVEKEMYTLSDRDGDSLALRPEGTASSVRMLQEHGLLYNQTQRVSYAGPMFRYEKPQKGRYRQFYQLGAEAYGLAGPDIDAELIALGWACWQALGIESMVQLEINTLGSGDARQRYRAALVDYLSPLLDQLDEDSRRRLSSNPMRILDSKNPATQQLLEKAPKLPDFVDADSTAHFEGLKTLLTERQIPFLENPNLVRGLDYYTHTVFEWITHDLGSQGAICAGGRYDGLVEKLGGRATPGVGFAIGLDRVVLLHELAHPEAASTAVDVYVCVAEPQLQGAALNTTQRLRAELPGIRIRLHMGGGNFKKQLKKADASGARVAVLVDADSVAGDMLTIKHLRDAELGQETLAASDGLARLQKSLA
ncbi:MAG: histidine--tRNA ligase [Gammaproteobacteria bacterium]|nr:histidine--tRNA ligase [Gammaproteobacteria bacterium]